MITKSTYQIVQSCTQPYSCSTLQFSFHSSDAMMEHYSHVVPHSHMFDDYECIYQSESMTCINTEQKLYAHIIILMRVYHIEHGYKCCCKYACHIPKVKSKVSSRCQDGHANPVKHWGASAIVGHKGPVLASPPGGALVPHRWGCHVPG